MFLSADGAAALLLLLLATFVLIEATGLSVGRARRPGPGILPLAIAAVLAVVALRLWFKAWLAAAPERIEAPRAYGFVMLIPAMLVFALLADVAGLALSSLALLLIAGTAVPGALHPRARALRFALYAVILSALTVILFAELLGLPIAVFPDWGG